MKTIRLVVKVVVLVLMFALVSSLAICQKTRKGTASTSQEKEDMLYVLNRLEEAKPTPVDLSDDVQYRVYMRQLAASGITAKKYPQFFKTIEAVRALHKRSGPPDRKAFLISATTTTIQPINVITQFGLNGTGQQIETSGLSSVKGGTIVTTLTLGVYDTSGNALGTPTQNVQYNQGENMGVRFSANAPSMTAATTPAKYMSLYHWSYVARDGTPYIGDMKVSAVLKPVQINNIAPKQTVSHASAQILLCQGRSGTNCDYGNLPGSQSNLVVPSQGNIVYTGNIDSIRYDASGQPTNAFCYFFVTLPDGGGGCPPLQGNINFFKDPNTTVVGNTLTWSRSPSNPISFGPACFALYQNVIYTMLVQVSIGGQPVTASITNAPNVDTTDRSYFKIPPTSFAWSCLAEGTTIMMANGLQKPIQYVEAFERVKGDAKGRILTVESTFKGEEEIPMVRIKDSDGNSLLLTEGHPVPTPTGIMLGKQLKKGQTIFTTKGKATITEASREKFDGHVWNLDVGMREDHVTLTKDNTTFFANNILVGDNKMQSYFGERHKKMKTTVLETIPKEWHQDYMNHIKGMK